MRIHNRLCLLSLLVPASFAVNVQAQEQEHAHDGAQPQGLVAVKGGRWSDPSTWTGGAVPKQGDIVTIGEGIDIVLDEAPNGGDGSAKTPPPK